MPEFLWSVVGVGKWLLIIAFVLILLLAYFQNNMLYAPSTLLIN